MVVVSCCGSVADRPWCFWRWNQAGPGEWGVCLLVLLCELQNVGAATERCSMCSVKKLGHIYFEGVHSNRLYQQQFWIIRNKFINPVILCIVQYQYLFSLFPCAVSFYFLCV